MSDLKQTDIEKIAHLARLALDANDVPVYAQNLTNILHLVEQMAVVDTTHIEPLAHPLPMSQRLRPDVVTAGDEHALFQRIAPQVEGGLYLVPKVIE
ncbi:MAG: Asp-tRNA(Asn)/Glu-tRNA(Gln) amidotransferase subunit GatC [Gammaproteobacteria bacterium]|nr:Asp-tRNA(Asn)/Glu-tRNA(Gln) amidotransferase subunit GatC [Gammaproteobacteria bacterium]